MSYLAHIGIIFSIYAILAVSLNLLVGYTGLLSVSQAALFGVGAYTAAVLSTSFGFGFFTILFFSICMGIIVSFLSGLLLSRFNGDYYALVSVGLNVIIINVFRNWDSVTHGPLGIYGILKPNILGTKLISNESFFVLAIILLAVTLLISRFVVKSSFGRVLKTIRDDEQIIQVFGYKTLNYKLFIFMISAAMASVAGTLYASYITFIEPNSFVLLESIFILAMVILGGLASLRGSLLGALVLVLLPEALRFVGFSPDIAAQMRYAIYGLFLILFMLYRPQGLVGGYKL